ncbi:disease resistance protein At4g27190-like [Tasmannia lanceolata]|uniref:disease resistance protein At4g27190-like n=1 Tax=Tasmannia lanceolata TaxID=3420 RepID=UPI0040641A5B
MVTVSQNPLVKNIQREIADQLGLPLKDESQSVRANKLVQRLKQEKRILVILDDLWERLDLEEVGIPYGDTHKGPYVIRMIHWCGVMHCDNYKNPYQHIEEMYGMVFLPLKLSFDHLESDETKLCFLFCCLFREDDDINVQLLTRYGMGEGLFSDADTLEEASDRMHILIDKLKSCCLLLQSDKEDV